MFKFLSKLSFISILFENGRALFRILIAILLFFVVERIYAKWAIFAGDLYPSISIGLLTIYTIVQISIVLWLLFSLKRISFTNKAKQKILTRTKAINSDEQKTFDEFKDVEAYPSLKKQV